MKISIVMATYNGEKFILQQIESIAKQDRRADEVLIFDDGSTDKTVEIIKKYVQENHLTNWRIHVNQVNKGWRKNFVDGLLVASGDIVFLSDQDDIWLPTKLSDCEKVMNDYPYIQLLATNYNSFFDNGKIVHHVKKDNGKVVKQVVERGMIILYPGCTYCVRKKLIEKLAQYWDKDNEHDSILWRMAMFSDSLYILNKTLLLWRIHLDSTYAKTTANRNTKEKKRDWIDYALRYVSKMQKFISNENCSSKRKVKILEGDQKWLRARATFYDTRSIIKGLCLVKYMRYYRRFKQYLSDLYFVLIKN